MSVETALDFLASEEGKKIIKNQKKNKKKKERKELIKNCVKEITIPFITSVLTTIVMNYLNK